MSKKTYLVLGIVVIAALLLGGFYYWNATQQTVQPENPEVSTLPSGSDTSDSAIDQDLAAIDAQIQAVGDDTDSADASVATAVAPQ
jgi:hypothetical protein